MHPFGIVQHAKVTILKHSTNLLSIKNVKANLLKIILSKLLYNTACQNEITELFISV